MKRPSIRLAVLVCLLLTLTALAGYRIAYFTPQPGVSHNAAIVH